MTAPIFEGGADVTIIHSHGVPKAVRINGVEIPATLRVEVVNEPNEIVHVRIDVAVRSVTWEPQL